MRGKQPNKSGQNEDFVRDTRPNGNKLAFESPTEINPHKRLEIQENLSLMHPLVIQDIKNHTQTMQRVLLRGAYECPLGLAERNELMSIHGKYLISHQHSPFAKCKALAATEAQIFAQVCWHTKSCNENILNEASWNLYQYMEPVQMGNCRFTMINRFKN